MELLIIYVVLIVNAILAYGGSINEDSISGPKKSSALVASASRGDLKGVESLLKLGADVNFQDQHGWSPIVWAATFNYPKIVELLIMNGASPESTDPDGRRIIAMAASNGHVDVVQILITNGAAIGCDVIIRAYLNDHDKVLEVIRKFATTIPEQLKYWTSYYFMTVFGDIFRSEKNAKRKKCMAAYAGGNTGTCEPG